MKTKNMASNKDWSASQTIAELFQNNSRKIYFLGILILILFLPYVLPSTTLATEILIFSIAVFGCNLLLGRVGLLSFGQAMFFGVGGYCGSLAMIHLNFGLGSGLLIGISSGAAVAVITGLFCVRRTGIYFIMLTFAFTQMCYFLAYTLSDWTGGENGLRNVPRPSLKFGDVTLLDLTSPLTFYWFVGILFVAIYLLFCRIEESPLGSTLLAIRENESRVMALGYNVRLFKLVAFVISGAVTGLSGALYAMLLNFVPLSNISLEMSERILIMTIIGGTGSLFGSVLGAGAIVLLGEVLSSIWPRWMLLLGLALIAVVIFMRGGLWGGLESILGRLNRRSNERRDEKAGS